jgi:hypothetical protein
MIQKKNKEKSEKLKDTLVFSFLKIFWKEKNTKCRIQVVR